MNAESRRAYLAQRESEQMQKAADSADDGTSCAHLEMASLYRQRIAEHDALNALS